MAKIIQNIKSGAIQLSPNFYLSEFTDTNQRGLDNTPDPLAVKNLFRMAALMEEVRALLGNKVISVNSGFRSPAVNKAVGGSLLSDHMRGEACDFVCRGYGTALQVASAIVNSKIKFGQLIMEGSWVHLSLPDGTNDGEVLTAHFFIDGKTNYTKGL